VHWASHTRQTLRDQGGTAGKQSHRQKRGCEDEYKQAGDGAEGEFFWSRPPKNFYLLPQYPNFRLKRCPATEIAGAGLDVSR
jgi:hypothetical protein